MISEFSPCIATKLRLCRRREDDVVAVASLPDGNGWVCHVEAVKLQSQQHRTADVKSGSPGDRCEQSHVKSIDDDSNDEQRKLICQLSIAFP